jgi:carbon-monoxide dehydrogenase medium subunit
VQGFIYLRPPSLSDAIGALSRHPEARPLAGGLSLLSAMKLRLNAPSHLIDLQDLPDLRGIRVAQDVVEIGAMVRHAAVAASDRVRSAIPALADLAGGIGDRQVRNRGTLGGSLANNDPAACYPAAVLGLGATVVTDRRAIAADDFFRGLFTTALEPAELILNVRFPVPRSAAYVKFHQPASRFALVGVLVAEMASGAIRVAVTGAGPSVFRSTELEAALAARFTPAKAESVTVPAEKLNADIHAGADYRAQLIPVLAGRAVERMLARGGG